MPSYDDENSSLTSSKKFGSIRFRKLDVSTKRRSELKATISGPHTFDGGGVSTTVLGGAPLRTLNGIRSPHPNSVSTVLDGSFPPPQTSVRGVRRNSDVPLRQHYSSLAWPSNHSTIAPVHGSPHRQTRTTHMKPRKVGISKPLALDSSRFSSTSGIPRERSPRSTQTNSGSRWSRTTATGILKGGLDELTSQELSFSGKQHQGFNPLGVPSDEFDPRTMMESLPALNMGLSIGAASFGSVKHRGVSKALRTSRTMLLSVHEKAKSDLAYMDDSDSFSSSPSTPSTPAWETTATSSMPETDLKLTNKLELADVHTQIQEMINSANRPFSTESWNHLGEDQEPLGTPRDDIPLSLRPSNPIFRSFPPLATTHKRCVSSPPLGSDIYRACQPDFPDRLLYRPVIPLVPHKPAPPVSSPPETTPTSPASPTPADTITPSTPTKKPSSERSDSPSVYSQPSPSSQTSDVTPTSSNVSSPNHPYAKSKHERLLAAISEGISSPTRPGPTAPSILGSGRGRTDDTNSAASPLDKEAQTVPVIVVTDPNDDDLVYSESGFSIIDMYAGSAENPEVGLRRRRTRTTHSVSRVSPFSIECVLITLQYQPRNAFDTPALRHSVSLNSPRLSQTTKERSPPSQEPLKKRASIFRPGLPSSFLSMSTLHEVEIAEATSTPRDRKSFYAAVGLKGLFRRSGSRGSSFGQTQTQTSGPAGTAGGGGGARPGSTLAAPNAEAGDDVSKGGWGLFKRKR